MTTTNDRTTTRITSKGWISIIADDERQSYASWLPFKNNHPPQDGGNHDHNVDTEEEEEEDKGTASRNQSSLFSSSSSWTTRRQLDEWFEALHPSNYHKLESDSLSKSTAWSDAYHDGEKLLRKTAWVTLDPDCECEYGYADTWQHQATHPGFVDIIQQITKSVLSSHNYHHHLFPFQKDESTENNENCSSSSPSSSSPQQPVGTPMFNAVNLNYYPHGGGVGFHADDEFLFDGINRPTCILSLSLCRASRSDDGDDNDGTAKSTDTDNLNPNNSTKDDDTSCTATVPPVVRKFVIKRKRPHDTEDTVQKFEEEYNEDSNNKNDGNDRHPTDSVSRSNEISVLLGHGDLMTMEGMFQNYYYHAVWPGDSKRYELMTTISERDEPQRNDNGDYDNIHGHYNDHHKDHRNHPYVVGERINLTWRLIVQHLDGSIDECRGKTCPLSSVATSAKTRRSV